VQRLSVRGRAQMKSEQHPTASSSSYASVKQEEPIFHFIDSMCFYSNESSSCLGSTCDG
jgi:hypothetical protein